jgi:hypothetical protein
VLTLASIRRILPPSLKRLAWGALGICSMALIVAVSAGFDPTDPAKKSPSTPEDKGVGKPAEAPAGFDNKTNGFENQAAFDKDRDSFEEVETIEKGLGPVYNATSCVSCHQDPVTGSSRQIAELRAGHRKPDPNDPSPRKVQFVEARGGSVIQQRAIDPGARPAGGRRAYSQDVEQRSGERVR